MAEKSEEMKKFHHVTGIEFTESTLILEVGGKRHEFELEAISELLSKATMEEKNQFEVAPSGYGIHWPLLLPL